MRADLDGSRAIGREAPSNRRLVYLALRHGRARGVGGLRGDHGGEKSEANRCPIFCVQTTRTRS